MINIFLLFSRQGKIRLQKWYSSYTEKEKQQLSRELIGNILNRKTRSCNFIEWKDKKVVWKRYAGLHFCAITDREDNELLILEVIHQYVVTLDKYFGNVCELDIIFNYEKAYYILDEFLLGGLVQETNKKEILRIINDHDLINEESQYGFFDDNGLG
ncbi:AP-1 complex subunit sigma-1 [Intoshia linei]|uniref:AP complex subunit sigma n=1 Tax=Intoshia linei TaxID=1819745 RepID=A0A177B1C8_9BILA|nr:AP-1 complex subunit sigma-1 [Intoshia linei]